LKDKAIFCIDCQQLIAEHAEENLNEEVIHHLKELIGKYVDHKKNEHILYFRDIEILMAVPQIGDFIQTIFRRPFPMIASISQDVKEEKIGQAITLLGHYNFSPFQLNESPIGDVYQIVKNHLKTYSTKNVIYTQDAVELSVRLAFKH